MQFINGLGFVVCFHFHFLFPRIKAAEKALKAAQFSEDATRSKQHKLWVLASPLGRPELSNLASELENLVGGSASMRYPDMTCYPKIPNDVYGHEQATKAHDLAQRILEKARDFMEERGIKVVKPP